MLAIFYKDYRGQWVEFRRRFTNERDANKALKIVRKRLALNGQAAIQTMA